MSVVSPLVRLRQALESHEPADARTYVEPAQSASARIARQIRLGSQGKKFLLVGPKGGGKSTELRALRRALNREVVPLGFDLDASGISAAGVSAFDVMYLSGLCFVDVLRRLDGSVAEESYRRLATAYADGEEPEVEGRSLSEALANFSSFVDAVGPLAGVVGVPEAAAGVLSKTLKLGAVKLLSKRTEVVPRPRRGGPAWPQFARSCRSSWRLGSGCRSASSSMDSRR